MERRLKGFTIIETMLVIAIGGLILAMVFIALPGVMAGQRDAERQTDAEMLVKKIRDYQANNGRGALPTGIGPIDSETDATQANSWGYFYQNELDDSFADPSLGNKYTLKVVNCTSDTSATVGINCTDASLPGEDGDLSGTMYVVKNASCDGAQAVYSAKARDFVVVYKLERGVLCANS